MRCLGVALLLTASTALAQTAPLEELRLLAEYPVEDMGGGNLSGLAGCDGELWAVSDREDDRLYRLELGEHSAVAKAEPLLAPPPPATPLPWGLRMRTWVAGQVRGGGLDFEGLSCDGQGNRYLLSEAHAAVLKVGRDGASAWLPLPDALVRQARASGMLLNFNALFEGIAVDPAGERLWLAAEREHRGLLVLHRQRSSWRCSGGCVLLSEGGAERVPTALGGEVRPRDFSGLSYYREKLFTLERQAHRICRRQLSDGAVERCWSFAGEALAEGRRYPSTLGQAEALWVDAEGAWIGLDNQNEARADGEQRPLLWRFAAPKQGWGGLR